LDSNGSPSVHVYQAADFLDRLNGQVAKRWALIASLIDPRMVVIRSAAKNGIVASAPRIPEFRESPHVVIEIASSKIAKFEESRLDQTSGRQESGSLVENRWEYNAEGSSESQNAREWAGVPENSVLAYPNAEFGVPSASAATQ
jgi:hypothetical protein